MCIPTTKCTLHGHFSGCKVESVVEEVIEKYFDDVSITVTEKDNVGKVIDLNVYAYNDDQLKADKAIAMAEELYDMTAEDDSGIIAVRYSFTSHMLVFAAVRVVYF